MALQPPTGTKKKKQNSGTQFTIDIDVKGVSFVLVLMALTMITVFYLGSIFGKAQRNPSDLQLSPGVKPVTEFKAPNNLKIYDVRQTNDELDALKSDFNQMKAKGDHLQKAEDQRSKEETARQKKEQSTQRGINPFQVDDLEKTREAQAKPTKSSEPTKAEAPSVTWPEQVLSDEVPKITEKQYSIQVMATRSNSKAKNIVKQLERKRFQAYITTGKVENTTIYRVRVGKDNKEKILKIKERLKGTVKGLGSKLPIIQIN